MLEQRMDELESYSRQWNLRLYGVSENKKENVRLQAVKICQSVLPGESGRLSEVIDIAHRLGHKSTADSRPRPIILQFTSRMMRNEVWKQAKTSTYLKANRFLFKEDFSKGDRERRSKLWPFVKQARDAAKTAFFVGARAFIQGEGEIKSRWIPQTVQEAMHYCFILRCW
ncbi:hypothetical protein QQF64_013561 [Cirrhinus molitorella]|uniref:Uncharacterized protein n=1 Tax=Cirrhinus molitorella TaxID=172907 RepID=A0ABR3LRI9_9TELE